MIDVNVGEFVVRNLAGAEMRLRVTNVTADRICCGGWEFDRETGAEVDDFLSWGPPPLMTGSYIIKEYAANA